MKLKNLFALSMAAAGLFASNAFAVEKIEFWTMSLKPKFTPYFTALAKKYEAQNPDVKIEWVDYQWDIIQKKMESRIASGKPPALVQLNVPWADDYANKGLIVPVDGLMGKAKASYAKGSIDDVTFKGKIYGFPQFSNVAIIAYNTKLFKDAGLSGAPKSLDDELAFAKQIHAKTGKAGYSPALGKIDGFFLQQGLPVIKDGKAVFNSPKHVALIEKLAASYKEGGLLKDNLFIEDNFPTAIDAYKGGRLGMLVAPPTALARIKADNKQVYAATGVAPAPLGPTGIADGGWLFHFAVPKGIDSKLMPAVGKFGLYLTNEENQLEFAKASGTLPSSVKAAKDKYFQTVSSDSGALEKGIATAANSMKHARSLYVSAPGIDELRRILVRAVEAGVTGKKDVKTALDDAVVIWNRKLSR